MRKFAIAFSLLVAVPTVGRAVDTKRLQELLYLPSISLRFGLAFDRDRGLIFWGAKRDYSSQIAQLRKGMLGDARDAERYHRIAKLYDAMNSDARAHEAFVQAEKLYRQRLKQQPGDAATLSALGDLLTDMERGQEGERLLRKAVELRPGDWQCWVNLGRWLETSAVRLSDRSDHGSKASSEATGLVQAAAVSSPDVVNRVKGLLHEATVCFDKAVACGPTQARPYRERCTFRVAEAVVIGKLHIPAEHADESNGFHPQSLVADCRRAADLDPTNLVDVAGAIMMNLSAAGVRLDDGDGWKRLPADVQRRFQQDLKRLEHLTQSDDRATAIGAHVMLAVTASALLRDKADAERHGRRAVSLDPAQDCSWEVLLGVIGIEDKADAALSVALEWLKQSESARKHYVLAQCYAQQKQWRMAEDHIRAALRLQPNDARANVAMAALVMKRSLDDSSLAEADRYLSKATNLLTDDAPQDLRLDYAVAYGVYFALKGDVAKARKLLNAVQKKDPKRKTPGKALEALER